MGVDKATLALAGQSLLGRAVACAQRVGGAIVIAGPEGLAERLPAGVERCADGPGHGPVAGLLGAASQWPRANWLVLACDLPLVTPGLLQRLRELARERPGSVAVVPQTDGRIQPLCAWYAPPMIARFQRAVKVGDFSLARLLATHPEGLRHGPVLFADAARLGWTDEALREELFNCNQPDDLVHARAVLKRRRRSSVVRGRS